MNPLVSLILRCMNGTCENKIWTRKKVETLFEFHVLMRKEKVNSDKKRYKTQLRLRIKQWDKLYNWLKQQVLFVRKAFDWMNKKYE